MLSNLAFLMKKFNKRNPFFSQASQDQFVHFLLYKCLHKQDVGFYLEIGAGDPVIDNNTYFFEKNYRWKGVSIDCDESRRNSWGAARQNPLLIEDATTSNYSSILTSYPPFVDYLSLDIDANYDVVLSRIPFDTYKFKIITIEHDFHRFGDKYRNDQRKILSSLGYSLVCGNVSVLFENKDCVFEDWWVHPDAFPADLISSLCDLGLNNRNHDQIIKAVENKISRLKLSSFKI